VFHCEKYFVVSWCVIAGETWNMARKPDDLHPTMVRLPEGLRRELERWADIHGRSLNGEIIFRLLQSLADTKSGRSLADRLDQIENNIELFAGIMRAQQKVAQDALDALKKAREEKGQPPSSATSSLVTGRRRDQYSGSFGPSGDDGEEK